jgi:hypothetical protein
VLAALCGNGKRITAKSRDDLVNHPGDSHVARQNNGGFESLGEWLDKWPCLVICICYRNVGTETAERLGATLGDGMLVCDTENNPFLPGKGTRCDVEHSELSVLNETIGIDYRNWFRSGLIPPPTGSPSIGAGRVQAGLQSPQKRGASAVCLHHWSK